MLRLRLLFRRSLTVNLRSATLDRFILAPTPDRCEERHYALHGVWPSVSESFPTERSPEPVSTIGFSVAPGAGIAAISSSCSPPSQKAALRRCG